MDMIANLALGFEAAFSPVNLLYCLIGVTLGTFIGVLPGIGALATISLLLPITYHLPPTAALIMLAGVYYGAQYGGSTASILLNLPGTPAAAVVCIDGYPMAKKGRSGVALFMTAIASFFGATIGILILMAFGPMIARIGLKFGPAEYFAMMLLGLVAASTLSHGSAVKGLAMVVLGILFGLIGMDVNSGIMRFTFGMMELADGISLIAVAMGLFGVAEVIASIRRGHDGLPGGKRITWRSMIPNRDDISRSWMPMTRGTGVGSFFGTLPGAGQAIASFMAYAVEKRVAREPERFGKGAIEGITAPEAASNASCQTAFIPTLTLGIPGDAVMALMLGALMIHGIAPGPQLMMHHPDLFWGLIASFWIGNVLLLVLNLPMIGLWVKLLAIPYRMMYPAILLFVCIGAYSVKNSVFDIGLVAVFGAVGYIMMLLRFQPAPLILGFMLGPLMEEHLRRALLISRGNLMVLVERPISAVFILLSALLLASALLPLLRGRGTRAAPPATETHESSARP